MTTVFEVGDRVQLLNCNYGCGTIIEKFYRPKGESQHLKVELDKGGTTDWYDNNDTRLINKKGNSVKLNAMLKLILGKDEKVLYKAGYIDGELKLTQKGTEALLALQFQSFKTDLVKAAQEDLDEMKEEKC